jgi:dienelactone hydrolase
MWKKILIGVLVVLAAVSLGFVAWASGTNPIQPEAQAALQSGSTVNVTTGSGGNWLIFQPAGQPPDTGLIFYPGGKVDFRAYAPYARALAEQGYLVVIPRMPLNLAVFDAAEAGEVMAAYPDIEHWAVGGHSLGGSMAANFAAKNTDQVDGLVFLAAYPASSDSLVNSNVKVVSIYGTNDGLATGEKIDTSHPLLPASTTFVPIQGGNHAQFGYYGAQNGDNPATVSQAEQQEQAITATVEMLASLSGE